MPEKFELSLGARSLSFECGSVARQADASCVVTMGGTVVLATVVADAKPKPGLGFFPLTVEYRAMASAAGQIPGSFIRREGRISDHEVITSRIVDRAIRPLFPAGFSCETQVLCRVMSADPEADPQILAANGAALALQLSDVPWGGPLAFLRLALVSGRLLLLPTHAERAIADLELVVALSDKGLVMLEGHAREADEEELLEALDVAEKTLLPALAKARAWALAHGTPKRSFPARESLCPEDMTRVQALGPAIAAALRTEGKRARSTAVSRAVASTLDSFAPEKRPLASMAVEKLKKAEIRKLTRSGTRIDGRGFSEIREVSCRAGWLPRAHGSSLFTRGETQAAVTCTLGGPAQALQVEDEFGPARRPFFLHYQFPPYCVGETRPMRGPGRREIGHGTLAYNALRPVVPDERAFPYVIRVLSEITESNGSSSMATVCGASLALLDAGVPISAPVAGVAMGLIKEDQDFLILSDILGAEDHAGDMDFKVAGTREGITALQMDNKIGAIPREVLRQALEQARRGRIHMLDKMAECLAAPRSEISAFAPVVRSIHIRENRVRDLIGSRGANLKDLQAATGAKVDVSQDGLVRILAKDAETGREALRRVRDLCGEVEVDRIYPARVVGVKGFGVFVRIFQGVEGLVPASDLVGDKRTDLSRLFKEGDTFNLKVLGVDHAGRLRLSKRAAEGAIAGG